MGGGPEGHSVTGGTSGSGGGVGVVAGLVVRRFAGALLAVVFRVVVRRLAGALRVVVRRLAVAFRAVVRRFAVARFTDVLRTIVRRFAGARRGVALRVVVRRFAAMLITSNVVVRLPPSFNASGCEMTSYTCLPQDQDEEPRHEMR